MKTRHPTTHGPRPMTCKEAVVLAAEMNKRHPHKDAEYVATAIDLRSNVNAYRIEMRRKMNYPGHVIQCEDSADGVCILNAALGSETIEEFVERVRATATEPCRGCGKTPCDEALLPDPDYG